MNLLSPGKPVLTRFKVPGEGAYTLASELHAPLPRHPPLPAAGASSNKSATSASGGATNTTPVASISGGPLGLTHVTSVSFARRASLTVTTQDNNSLHSPILSSGSMAPPTPPLASSQNAPASTGSSSIFSLRKLTGLGSTFTSKFGSASTSTDATSSLGSNAVDDTVPTNTPSAPSRWFSSAASVVAGTSAPTNSQSGNPTPRAPPRAALDSAGPQTDIASNSASSRTSSSRNNSSYLRDISPSSSSSRSRSRSRGERNSSSSRGNRPLGVLIYNTSDCVCAVDLPESKPLKNSAPRNTLEPTLTLGMRSAPTAHLTLNHEKLILIVGCANGEINYYPDISSAATTPQESGKRSRGGSIAASTTSNPSNPGPIHPAYFIYNRDGTINSSRVVALKWVPGTVHRFVAAHVDGALIVYDTRFKPHSNAVRGGPLPSLPTDSEAPSTSTISSSSSAGPSLSLRVTGNREGTDKNANDKPDPNRDQKSTGSGSEKSSGGPGHRRSGSQAVTQLAQHEISVHRLPRKKSNSLVIWQIGNGFITDIAFAPMRSKNDQVLLAISGRDGYLRIVDFNRECPVAAFRSYFGALLCVSWSPDGKYVATGGEDDLVSIWCPSEERIVARLEGHTSWVSAVAWDRPVVGARYRLASAGQDTKLLLWDFAVNMLHHRVSHPRSGAPMVRLRSYAREPKEPAASPPPPPPPTKEERRTGKLARLRAHASAHSSTHPHVSASDNDNATPVGPQETPLIVGALGRAEVPIVEPVLTHVAHCEPLTHVMFQDVGVVTADSFGTVKLWSRPPTHDLAPISLANKDDPMPDNTRRRGGGSRKARNSDLD